MTRDKCGIVKKISTSNYYIFCFILTASAHKICNHVYPTDDEVITGVYLESHRQKRDLNKHLRMRLHYDDSVYRLSKEKFEMINGTILPEAVIFWEKALMIRKPETRIRLYRRCKDNQVFILPDDPHPYCKDNCEHETKCGEVIVPEQHLNKCRVCNSNGYSCNKTGDEGPGIENADFILYISALQTERCKKGFTVAYAAHCQQEASLDRPIAGHANLCPSSISLKEQEMETLLSTVKHEILHALGFSVSLYAFYRDENGLPLTKRSANGKPPILNEKLKARQWSENVIKKIVINDWVVAGKRTKKEMNIVVTPKVVREARLHFNCSTLEGVELENQGPEGTALTHWEKRIFENEAMTGTHTQNPIYSRITFALMEDTGWYFSNYSMAQPLAWGSNLGCDFVKKSCREWMDTKLSKGENIHPFCNMIKKDTLQTECTANRKSLALCNLVEYPNDLPDYYQNFGPDPDTTEKYPNSSINLENSKAYLSIPGVSGNFSRYGGSVTLADYCPYIQEFTWKIEDKIVRGSQCQFLENNPDPDRNFALENYSTKSRCFNHAAEWKERNCSQVRNWQHWGSGCYSYICENNRLHVQVSNYTYTCFYTDQVLDIRVSDEEWLHEGKIICPPCIDLCNGSNETCLADNEVPENFRYNYDFLTCASQSLFVYHDIIVLSILFSFTILI